MIRSWGFWPLLLVLGIPFGSGHYSVGCCQGKPGLLAVSGCVRTRRASGTVDDNFPLNRLVLFLRWASHFVVQAGLKLIDWILQLPNSWDYTTPCWVFIHYQFPSFGYSVDISKQTNDANFWKNASRGGEYMWGLALRVRGKERFGVGYSCPLQS